MHEVDNVLKALARWFAYVTATGFGIMSITWFITVFLGFPFNFFEWNLGTKGLYLFLTVLIGSILMAMLPIINDNMKGK